MKWMLGCGVAAVLWSCAAVAAPAAKGDVVRGRYLVQSIAGCGNCHTPQGPRGPVAGLALAGGQVIEDPGFKAVASNITPDKETGIGAWTDEQIATAIREGRRPDGSLIGPPMPFGLYRHISDRDIASIVAFLRTVKPVKNAVAKSQYSFPLPPAWGPPVTSVPEVNRKDKLAWGAYLAGPLGHCMECHSAPGANGVPDLVNGLGAGGMAFHGPWGKTVAPNITPTALKRYNDAQLRRIITQGVRPDRTQLRPPMGVAYYARMTRSDLDALVAYLRALPPK